MTRPKVADEIFPLKELRVRGEIQNSLTLYQDNISAIDKLNGREETVFAARKEKLKAVRLNLHHIRRIKWRGPYNKQTNYRYLVFLPLLG